MDLRQLRYFVAVAEELHFGRAAARLHMTQPPLSQQIRQLETDLGATLLARTQRTVALSPAGAWLLPHARRLLAEAEGLAAGVQRAAQGQTETLTLAFVSIADYALLPDLLRAFRARFPDVALTLRESTSDIQFDDLLRGRIDAGLLIPPVPPEMAGEIAYLPLLREPLIVALPGALARRVPREGVAISMLARQPLVIFPRRLAPALHDMIVGVFHRAGLSPHIAQEAGQMQTIVGLVAGGLGVALVPQSIAKLRRPGVVYRPLLDATPAVEVGLAWRRDGRSAALQALIEWTRQRALVA